MQVFITGATGFIGQALIDRLLSDGHQITAWVRDEVRARATLGEAVTLLSTSAPDEALKDALSTCQGVVNLAGAPLVGRRWTASYRRELVSSRVDLTRRLMAGITPGGPQVILSGSAVGIYGDRGDEVLSEQSAPGDDFQAEICTGWEAAATDGAPAGCRVVLLRTGVVLERDGGALQTMLPIFRSGIGGAIGNGRQYMSWIHRDDIVAIITAALEDARFTGAINLTAPSPVTNAAFTKALGKALRRPTILPVPPLALRAIFGEASNVMTASLRVMPERLKALGYDFKYPELSGALEAIFASR